MIAFAFNGTSGSGQDGHGAFRQARQTLMGMHAKRRPGQEEMKRKEYLLTQTRLSLLLTLGKGNPLVQKSRILPPPQSQNKKG
eukprot:531271-Pelagomonas_calceolata.AAC.1